MTNYISECVVFSDIAVIISKHHSTIVSTNPSPALLVLRCSLLLSNDTEIS